MEGVSSELASKPMCGVLASRNRWPSLGWDKLCVLLLAGREREAAGREEEAWSPAETQGWRGGDSPSSVSQPPLSFDLSPLDMSLLPAARSRSGPASFHPHSEENLSFRALVHPLRSPLSIRTSERQV
ncbi:hypothetical protein Q8A67_025568 [Cirrhinus molitorella]|uniref:Uncharacterized protein n=1 Tax=Cirrhinus molitorella TaxID=172907 RepID=A0AA88NUQ6_9TELE|nr:hypothetical protein Q8A67_025568 [Cirrhinus molitorella]